MPGEATARNKANLKRITTHWPDMLRVAGSLITNQVRAHDLLRMFGAAHRPGIPPPPHPHDPPRRPGTLVVGETRYATLGPQRIPMYTHPVPSSSAEKITGM